MTTDGRSFLDKMFDVADSALGSVEAALPDKEVQDAEFIDMPDNEKKRISDWEKTWEKKTFWAIANKGKLGEGHHVFPEDSLRAVCGAVFNSDDISDRREALEHGKRIVACTSCVIIVSRV